MIIQIRIDSERYLVPDETNVPVGDERAVAGTACDFRQPRRLGDSFSELPNGFEHYYAFAASDGSVNKVAEFAEASSGRTLEVYTSEPGMLFYTGYYTSDDLARGRYTFRPIPGLLLRDVEIPERPQYSGVASQYPATRPTVRRNDGLQVWLGEERLKTEG